MEFKYDVFLNYAVEDLAHAQKLKDGLSRIGLKVFFDRESLSAGSQWKQEIRNCLASSRYFVLLVSSTSVEKKEGYVWNEIESAISISETHPNSSFLIPVLIDGSSLSHPRLKELHFISLHKDWNKGFQLLIKSIGGFKDRLKSNRKFIGFDFGHGESALSITNLFSRDSPKSIPINGKASIITAVGIHKDKGVLIGEDALTIRGTKGIKIMFKSVSFEQKQTTELIKLFINKCLDLLVEAGNIDLSEDVYFVVGCPSAWSIKKRNAFQKLLSSTRMKNVLVFAESRAAFLEAREAGEFSRNAQEFIQNVLIIDIGSSTTDLTEVKNLQENPQDFGHPQLGAGLIDHALFKQTLKTYEEEDKERLLETFSQHPELEVKCLYACRKSKERYFFKEEDSWEDHPVEENLKLKKGLYFDIELYKKDMQNVLAMPHPELNGKSWPEAFRDLLLDYHSDPIRPTPNLIIMTGGGSKMQFTKEICKAIFPEPATKIIVGNEPSLSISKGLSITAKLDYKISQFKIEIDDFIESEVLVDVCKNKLGELIDPIAETLDQELETIIIKKFVEWRDGEIKTLKELNRSTESQFKEHIESKGFKKDFNRLLTDWIKDLNPEVEKLTSPLCKKYDIEQGSINLKGFTANSKNYLNQVQGFNLLEEFVSEVEGAVIGIVVLAGFLGLLVTAVFGKLGIIILGARALIEWAIHENKSDDQDKKEKKATPPPPPANQPEISTAIIQNIPIWMRKKMLSENRIKKLIQKHREKEGFKIKESLDKGLATKANISKIISPVKKILNASADQARLLIR